jgi:pantoate--beta-alanine ligase
MLTASTVPQLRELISQWKQKGDRIAFVPTMGNLHSGHLALVDFARQLADRVVVSIFVNPAQFGPNEDFERYPRTLEDDSESLVSHDVDLLFHPSVETMYGDGGESVMVNVPAELNNMLCGLSRPGHFDGVATVVAKLFNQVEPDLAVFGEKDFQQLVVIRRLVKDLAFPVEIVGHQTMRESDGLAMSSRNGYLTSDERAVAPQLQQALQLLVEEMKALPRDSESMLEEMNQQLTASGFMVEYLEIRRQADLGIPGPDDKRLVALVAARLGQTRLIDNLLFELD